MLRTRAKWISYKHEKQNFARGSESQNPGFKSQFGHYTILHCILSSLHKMERMISAWWLLCTLEMTVVHSAWTIKASLTCGPSLPLKILISPNPSINPSGFNFVEMLENLANGTTTAMWTRMPTQITTRRWLGTRRMELPAPDHFHATSSKFLSMSVSSSMKSS